MAERPTGIDLGAHHALDGWGRTDDGPRTRPGGALTFGRRGFLVGLAAVGLASCARGLGNGGWEVTGVADPAPVPGVPSGVFTLGVASGDPTPDGFILWTRLAPQPLAGGGMPDATVPVRWQLARDAGFTQLVADGLVKTSAAVAHSVHVEVTRLQPATTYYYRFTTGGQVSATGRTRTAPAAGAPVAHARLAVASCQAWTDGYYGAWAQIVADQPDVVVFLGDYIYEGGGSDVRAHNSGEITTLADYRNRHALYKTDPNLRAAHAAAPWIITWDDHEVENNSAAFVPESSADGPTFAARRQAAYHAFWEHMPIRSLPDGPSLQMYRSLQWGSLLDVMVLDGRQYRDDQPCPLDIGTCAARTDPARSMLGDEQLAWLAGELDQERGRWSVVANQTIITPMPILGNYNLDQWDGYAADRDRVIDLLAGVRNPVVLTGDIHAAGVGRIRKEASGSPTVGTELIATSITSEVGDLGATALNIAVSGLSQLPYFDARYRGYTRCDVYPDRWDADFVRVDATTATPGPPLLQAAWRITDGNRTAQPR